MRRLLPRPGRAGRRRAGRRLPGARRAAPAGQLHRLPGRRGHRRRAAAGARAPRATGGSSTRPAGADRRRPRRARDGVRRGLRAGAPPTPPSAGCGRRSAGRPTAPIAVVSQAGLARPGRRSGHRRRRPHDPHHLRVLRRPTAGGAGRRGRARAGLRGRRGRPAARPGPAGGSRPRARALRGRADVVPRGARRRGGGRTGPVDRPGARRREPRLLSGLPGAVRLDLRRVLEEDGVLFARYALDAPGPGSRRSRPAQRVDRLLDGQQHGRLDRASAPPPPIASAPRPSATLSGASQRLIAVVLAERVPEPVQLAADRLDVGLGGAAAVLRAGRSSSPRSPGCS